MCSQLENTFYKFNWISQLDNQLQKIVQRKTSGP